MSKTFEPCPSTTTSTSRTRTTMGESDYDVIVVGAGIAGCAMAHALAHLPRSTPLRIALLERSLAEPDRIVGELLQPGGVSALKTLGMESCLEGIDAVKVHGYCVVQPGETVQIPYTENHEGTAYEGRSFHHGRFINALREKARTAPGVETIEATVSELVECDQTARVIGVRATRKDATYKETFYAQLVVVADGCFSNFRTSVMGTAAIKPTTKSHFVGAIIKDAQLPFSKHGTVVFVPSFGPVLFYQVSEHDTRMLVDVKAPLPSDLKTHILTNIVPALPTALQLPVQEAIEEQRLRRMPNSFLPPSKQGTSETKEGVVLLGDSWNMRHPLTGGGMTVAFNDVVMLSQLLADVDLGDWQEVRDVLEDWHWKRKPLASTINILSVALYDLFGGGDENLVVLRTGCFKYFQMGGECIRGPVSLLSGVAPEPVLLFNHFFAVAFYSIWVMFTHERVVSTSSEGKPVMRAPGIEEYPWMFFKSFHVFWTACVVFGPLLWTEVKWT